MESCSKVGLQKRDGSVEECGEGEGSEGKRQVRARWLKAAWLMLCCARVLYYTGAVLCTYTAACAVLCTRIKLVPVLCT